MKSKILVAMLLISMVALSGCTDISDSYKPGSFGTTEEEKQIVDAVTEKYGDMTAKGEPRLLEVMMTSSTQNVIPVDKVLKYSKDSEELYAWFIYDNFENDKINVEWIYLDNDYSIHTFESETGEDFGRGTFILEKPDDGWPLGNYKVVISGAGVEESVGFEIIDGKTVSIPLELLAGTTIDSQKTEFENAETTGELPIPQSGFKSESTSSSFIGEWTSNWGDMTFKQSGNKIIGEYTHDKGKLEGVVNGDVFIGTWSESPSYAAPNDAGDVELKLSKDGNSFEGNWRYGSDNSAWSGGWTGTRVGQSASKEIIDTVPTPQSGFVSESTSSSFIGEWSSNWGDMTFTQSGNKIVGEYTHDKGRLAGVMNGDVFIGTWSESPSYAAPNDAGDVELKLSKDGNSFEGNWRYGSDSSAWSGGWTGTRVAQ
ncbi:hypothetical protein [Methanolobus psychrotolerans]|uniref:hypothetical protein n=1 Tax=Methanolobus psychrotolerans TaxID=1874706 RepID=UPI000B91C44B|nr:hypothetical protein [Methanolobus psychrotolerans]